MANFKRAMSFLCLLFTSGVTAAQGDALPDLDGMIIDVNGADPRMVARGETLVVVRGDSIRVRSAVLTDRQKKVRDVNVVGFPNRDRHKPVDDRGYTVRTDKDLLKKYSRDGEGKVYSIRALSGTREHGRVFISLVEPRLDYAVVRINGQQKVLHDTRPFLVKRSDRFEVEKVVTNLQNQKEEVTFQLVPVLESPDPALQGIGIFEIKFSRRDLVFARIPVHIGAE